MSKIYSQSLDLSIGYQSIAHWIVISFITWHRIWLNQQRLCSYFQYLGEYVLARSNKTHYEHWWIAFTRMVIKYFDISAIKTRNRYINQIPIRSVSLVVAFYLSMTSILTPIILSNSITNNWIVLDHISQRFCSLISLFLQSLVVMAFTITLHPLWMTLSKIVSQYQSEEGRLWEYFESNKDQKICKFLKSDMMSTISFI